MTHQHEVPAWVERHRQLAAGYKADPNVPKGVAKRLGRHLALLDLVGELIAEAFKLREYQSLVRACIGAVMESAQDADKPKEALEEVVSQAFTQRARLFGEAGYDPMLGFIGKREVRCGDVPCLALTGDFVRKALSAAGYNYHGIVRSWATSGYVVTSAGNRSQRICKLDREVLRCFCLKWSTIDAFMPIEA